MRGTGNLGKFAMQIGQRGQVDGFGRIVFAQNACSIKTGTGVVCAIYCKAVIAGHAHRSRNTVVGGYSGNDKGGDTQCIQPLFQVGADKGAVDGTQLAIVIPAIYLMGSQVQYMGRCLGVIGIQGSDMFKIMAVPPIVALLSLWVMRLVVLGS